MNKRISPISFTLLILFIVNLLSLKAKAQTDSITKGKEISVGLAGGAPFVVVEQGKKTAGIAVEIWEDIANKNKWKYKYTEFQSVRDAIAALDNHQIDMVVGPLSITAERVSHIRFSQPYYQSSLGLVSRVDKPSLWDRVKPFFSFKLLIAVVIFLFILSLVGTLLWLAERKESPDQFPSEPTSGIANGMWLAIVTMSTTGYGDKAPITVWGRIIAGTWMVVSIIFATSMVAGIASTLTLSGFGDDTINNVEQLEGKSATTISGSPTEEFLEEHNVKETSSDNLKEAFDKLKNKEVDAVIYDRPQLLYYLKNNKDSKLFVSKAEYYKQGYGFAFPLDTKLSHAVNIKLLELAEDEKTYKIIKHWLGNDNL
ncbi:transporter substrate-binding domain-containing protein [Pedobacter arcticus]|uniref:transporter substrate-binding domain-containing protein n=1 Tax=Pedobacter arcticus TaxID=752140 RepID=UPI0002D87D87|nr:transporter substrate-binding domain-containing protein [Pedobacter arcticus]